MFSPSLLIVSLVVAATNVVGQRKTPFVTAEANPVFKWSTLLRVQRLVILYMPADLSISWYRATVSLADRVISGPSRLQVNWLV